MILVKKYANRRLYDTQASAYVTLEELAEKVRGGAEVRIIDADGGHDLTQATLAQIILESRGGARLLPVTLLTRMVRLGDDALAEFLGTYVTWALEVYIQAKQNVRTLMPFSPFGGGLGGGSMGRMFGWGEMPPPAPPTPAPPAPGSTDSAVAGAASDDVDELRREIGTLKRRLRRKKK